MKKVKSVLLIICVIAFIIASMVVTSALAFEQFESGSGTAYAYGSASSNGGSATTSLGAVGIYRSAQCRITYGYTPLNGTGGVYSAYGEVTSNYTGDTTSECGLLVGHSPFYVPTLAAVGSHTAGNGSCDTDTYYG